VAGGINLYVYASNNPFRWFDPWGLNPETAGEDIQGDHSTIGKGKGGDLENGVVKQEMTIPYCVGRKGGFPGDRIVVEGNITVYQNGVDEGFGILISGETEAHWGAALPIGGISIGLGERVVFDVNESSLIGNQETGDFTFNGGFSYEKTVYLQSRRVEYYAFILKGNIINETYEYIWKE